MAYHEYFEPYVIASRRWLPRYDESFRGYGMNKVSHLYECAAKGAAFIVIPTHFVAAHEHGKSASWQATFGSGANPVQRMRVAAAYSRFKRATGPLPQQPSLPAAPPMAATAVQRAAAKRTASAEKDTALVAPPTAKRFRAGACCARAARRQRRRSDKPNALAPSLIGV